MDLKQTKKGITILGSTGSVGVSTLDILQQHSADFRVIALTANTNVDKMLQQCLLHQPLYAVMADYDATEKLQQHIKKQGLDVQILAGNEGLEKVASLPETDYVMAAIVGAAGLLPSLAAARAGKRVMLANKEALVMSGQLFMDTVSQNKAELLPIDSEHNAIYQCLPVDKQYSGVRKILLTASGGPFRTWKKQDLHQVTPAQAIAHPNWVMGHKISVDSATMMNKGLEVIEACWLFNVKRDKIQVVIHPQSVIHSMVSYNDGSVLAQLGNPDMRTPIAYALGYPNRIDSGVAQLDIFDVAQLDFAKPDFSQYPCLALAYQAHQMGGYATIALNAANEIAVDAFLHEKIKFTQIPTLIESVLEKSPTGTPHELTDILRQDEISRKMAKDYLFSQHSHQKD